MLLLRLPEALLALIFSLAGLPFTSNASMCCRKLHAHVWESPSFWRNFLSGIGVPDMAPVCSGSERQAVNHLSEAKAWQNIARIRLFGIDLLVMPAQMSGECGATAFEDARRAVLAIRAEDGHDLINRAAVSITELLRARKPGHCELAKAEALLEAVASLSEIFNTAQMLDMLGAHQQADEKNALLFVPKHLKAPY
jgi:hypothetical protein